MAVFSAWVLAVLGTGRLMRPQILSHLCWRSTRKWAHLTTKCSPRAPWQCPALSDRRMRHGLPVSPRSSGCLCVAKRPKLWRRLCGAASGTTPYSLPVTWTQPRTVTLLQSLHKRHYRAAPLSALSTRCCRVQASRWQTRMRWVMGARAWRAPTSTPLPMARTTGAILCASDGGKTSPFWFQIALAGMPPLLLRLVTVCERQAAFSPRIAAISPQMLRLPLWTHLFTLSAQTSQPVLRLRFAGQHLIRLPFSALNFMSMQKGWGTRSLFCRASRVRRSPMPCFLRMCDLWGSPHGISMRSLLLSKRPPLKFVRATFTGFFWTSWAKRRTAFVAAIRAAPPGGRKGFRR
eukprot:Opistho-2@63860